MENNTNQTGEPIDGVQNTQGEETGNVGTQANSNPDGGKAEKTFTQDEVNSMLKKEKQKAEKTLKQAEKMIANLNNANAVRDAGVKKEFVKFVTAEVSGLDGDFSENLIKFLKENTQYTNTTQAVKTVGTSAKLEGNARTETTTNQIMNNIIRSVRN